MSELILTSISQYFLFYLFNYTLICEKIQSKTKYYFNLFKVSGNWKYNLLYPMFCPLCFTFHLSWLGLIFQTIFNINIGLTIWNLFVGPIIAILLDNILKITGKNAS